MVGRSRPGRLRSLLPYIAVALIVIGFVNFFWFALESEALGGDALNGYARDGHFFVGSHGVHTEVSAAAWQWSRAHALSLFVTHPLTMLAMALLIFRYVFPRSTGAADVDPRRIQAIRASGPVLASARCGGRIGNVNMSAPLLRASVRPGGILLEPVFMRTIGIRSTDVRGVAYGRALFSSVADVDHVDPSVPSPLRLYLRAGSPVARAIDELVAPSSRGETPARDASASDAWMATDPVVRLLGAIGVVVNVVFLVWIATYVAQLGLAGLPFVLVALGITALNLRRFMLSELRRRRRP